MDGQSIFKPFIQTPNQHPIARLGSQTTMTSSIAPKHMSMHNRRRMGRSEGSIFFQTQPLILVSSERSFASCGNKQARSNPTTKMEKAMFFPDFSRCFNRTHNKTTHNTRSPRAPERSVWNGHHRSTRVIAPSMASLFTACPKPGHEDA